MKINKNAIIGGIAVGTATYLIAKRNWKFALIGLVAGGVAGYYVGEMMAKKSAPAPMPINDDASDEETSSFDESDEPRFQWDSTINKMMPVGDVNESSADSEYQIDRKELDLDLDFQ